MKLINRSQCYGTVDQAANCSTNIPYGCQFKSLIQPPANVPEEAEEDGTCLWAPATQLRDPDGMLGSHLQSDPVLALWEVKTANERYLCLPVSVFLPFKYTN